MICPPPHSLLVSTGVDCLPDVKLVVKGVHKLTHVWTIAARCVLGYETCCNQRSETVQRIHEAGFSEGSQMTFNTKKRPIFVNCVGGVVWLLQSAPNLCTLECRRLELSKTPKIIKIGPQSIENGPFKVGET